MNKVVLKKSVARLQDSIKKLKMTEGRRRKELAILSKRLVVAHMAFEAFDRGVPEDEGPVWFEEDGWKTDYWKQQWKNRKAFREGQKARAEFGAKSENPYRKSELPFSSQQLQLEASWDAGFSNE